MGKYLAPLGVFLGGQLLLLVLLIFLPSIGEAGATAAANPHAATFWGFEWVGNSIKIIVFVIGELLVLFSTGVTFLKGRS